MDQVWQSFVSTHHPLLREQLIVHYQPLVRKTAFQLLRRLPSHFDVDDLIAYGQFGLLDAIGRFDPELGNQFETFASTRIRGAMYDELRMLDWAPRRVRSTAREIETVHDMLARELGRQPLLSEVAQRIGAEEAELVGVLAEVSQASLGSLDGAPEWSEREDVGESDYALNAELAATQDAMARAISRLSAQDQRIIQMYYLSILRMKEIGKLLGLGESRACAAHARAIMLLREQMALIR